MTPNDLIATAIHRERTRMGLSLSALAVKSSLAKSTLSQLEAGKGNPSIETLWAIAEALNVTFSTLFEVSTPDVSIIRAHEGPTVGSDHATYQTTLLTNCPPGTRRDLYRVDLEPGSIRSSDPHPIGTVEHAMLCHGQARVGPKDAEEILYPGDYYRYPADRPHVYEALEVGSKLIVVMETRE
ncbi:MAG: XRE family transcriptional regulator [Pseudoruegeria sp.]